MPRSVAEWHGKTDDTPIPTRVKLRVYGRYKGRCAICGGKVLPAEYDHIERLKDGGENRERNIQLLCRPCHAAKSAQEQTEGAKVDRIKAKHIGVSKRKGRPMAGTKASGWKRKIDGTVERRT